MGGSDRLWGYWHAFDHPVAVWLILVIVGGAELFTGNNLIVMAWASGHVSTARMLRNWGIVYLGNFVGSVATAVITATVFGGGVQASVNGSVVSCPSSVAPWKNCTLAIVPSGSRAVAIRVVEPPWGTNVGDALSDTTGGALPAGAAITTTVLELVCAPALSTATTRNEWLPALGGVYDSVYGGAVLWAICVAPL